MTVHGFTLRRPHLPVLVLLMAAMDFAMGAIYVFEPRARTLSPALSQARALMPIWIWGLAIAVIGIVSILAVAWDRHPHFTMSLGVGWHMFFTLSLVLSVASDGHANAAGIPVFLTLTILHFLASRQR